MDRATRLAIGCIAMMLSLASALGEPATATEADPGLAATGSAETVSSAILPEQPLWRRCGDATTTVECAWLEVPIDHADPESDSIRLLVSRMRALDEPDRVGVLVTIAAVRASGARTASTRERTRPRSRRGSISSVGILAARHTSL